MEKRQAEGGTGSSTFGSAGGGSSTSASLPWPLTRVAAPGGEGGKASARVTVGELGFVSLASEEDGGGAASDDGEAAAAALLGRLDVGKEDVAVVMLVVGPGQGAGAHRALDAWVDPGHLPVRQVVEQGGQEGPKKAQLFAVVRAR